MELFYSVKKQENFIFLENDEYRHCAKVLRKSIGDSINITDGKGHLYIGKIEEISKNNVKIKIFESIFFENNEKFALAVAPTKNAERIEWMLEKAVEIGLKSIQFIICEKSERKTLNIKRLEKIAISAIKQSNRFWLPQIFEPVSFNNYIEMNENGYIAHCASDEKLNFNPDLTKINIDVLIGPEGDFTENEIKNALRKNFVPVSLGNYRLRTETAALYACNVLKFLMRKN
ncbi:MAG: 16S rRNA (uracil(1498)-N(3))-methyltransferase [Bacteroidetes bacterium]|nr:16S rRNA (uracil(1498)-N(3))-methyltransferase [Bacteroidota bacterium]